MLKDTIAQLNTISKLKITRGFAVSAKTGFGIEELKNEMLRLVPAQAVPSSYEKLLGELRSQSKESKQSFLFFEEAEKLALADKVRVSRCLSNHLPVYRRLY